MTTDPPRICVLLPQPQHLAGEAGFPTQTDSHACAGQYSATATAKEADAQNLPLVFYFMPGQTLAQALYLSGTVRAPALCSGLGHCGRCRVRLVNPADLPPSPEDIRYFSSSLLEQGWRLSCHHVPQPGLQVALPADTKLIPPVHSKSEEIQFVDQEAHVLALDLGTTSLAWQLLAPTGKVVAAGGMPNPQAGAGSDVVSRLSFARTAYGFERLHQLVGQALISLLKKTGYPVSGLCLAANTAMTCLALGKSAEGLFTAPYRLPYTGGVWENLPGLPPVWVPPQLAPFVGGDIAAGYAALAFGEQPPEYPFLLADLGTNGEFLLALAPDKALVASVAMGPALEGTGLHCGTEFRQGAVSQYTLTPTGLMPHCGVDAGGLDAPANPPGITGTGYLTLFHHLLQARAMTKAGSFCLEKSPLIQRQAKKNANQAVEAGKWLHSKEPVLFLPGGLYVAASDVEAVLKVKAAFSLGLQCLLAEARIPLREVRKLYISGALGTNIAPAVLASVGFLPTGYEGKVILAGNTALAGAGVLALSDKARQSLVHWADGVGTVDLANNKMFSHEFLQHVCFGWVECA